MFQEFTVKNAKCKRSVCAMDVLEVTQFLLNMDSIFDMGVGGVKKQSLQIST